MAEKLVPTLCGNESPDFPATVSKTRSNSATPKGAREGQAPDEPVSFLGLLAGEPMCEHPARRAEGSQHQVRGIRSTTVRPCNRSVPAIATACTSHFNSPAAGEISTIIVVI